MFRHLITLIVLLSVSISGFAADLDPAYQQFFKPGTIAVSSRGMPSKAKFDEKQFEYRDGRFFIPLKEDVSLDLRAILPLGKTLGSAFSAVVGEFKKEAETSDYHAISWRIWRSHDEQGIELVSASAPWPVNLADIPAFAKPVAAHTDMLSEESMAWNSAALSWSRCFVNDLKPVLKTAKPGHRLYILMTVGFETKDVASKTIMIHSDPLAAATIEFVAPDGAASSPVSAPTSDPASSPVTPAAGGN